MTAAALKWLALLTYPSRSGIATPLGLICAEITLAVVILFAGSDRRVRFIGAAVFFGFALVSILRRWLGYQTCGCFGMVAVYPGATALLDVVLGTSLLASGATRGEQSRGRGIGRRVWMIAGMVVAALALPIIASSIYFAAHAATDDLADAATEPNARVRLHPPSWVGHRFPLFPFAARAAPIQVGRWSVVLHDDGCGVCLSHLPAYEDALHQCEARGAHFALVDVAPPARVSTTPQLDGRAAFLRTSLDFSKQWRVPTPTRLELLDGTVVGVD